MYILPVCVLFFLYTSITTRNAYKARVHVILYVTREYTTRTREVLLLMNNVKYTRTWGTCL